MAQKKQEIKAEIIYRLNQSSVVYLNTKNSVKPDDDPETQKQRDDYLSTMINSVEKFSFQKWMLNGFKWQSLSSLITELANFSDYSEEYREFYTLKEIIKASKLEPWQKGILRRYFIAKMSLKNPS